jgi:acylphosphatase
MSLLKTHVFVCGRVQGVFFRAFTKRQADKLGLSGWARNLPDGRVEVMLVGDPSSIDKMVKWLWKASPAAKVTDVVIQSQEKADKNEFGGRFNGL